MTPPLIHDTGETRFRNWHENYTVSLARRVDVWNGDPGRSTLPGYRDTTEGLQGLIKNAMDAGHRVRALGGGWSFSRAPATDGLLINTKPLNYKFRLAASAVSGQFQGNGSNLYFVQGGNSVAELNHYLFDKDKSLPTSGASNGQTIAGAMSTGTHGAAIDVGSVADFVRAIHLIVSPTRHVWLERASNPVVQNAQLPDKLGAEVIRDDAIFNAALVSFGSFGIVHGVVIEVDDKYFLNVFRKKRAFSNALRHTMGDLDFSRLTLPRAERPYHFQVIFNPFEQDKAFLTAMFKDRQRPPGANPPEPPSRITQGDDAFGIVSVITDLFGDLTPVLAMGLTAIGLKDIENISGTPGQIFRDTSTRGKAASSAMGLPLSHVGQALDALFQLHDEERAPVIFACRFVKSTEATLGFTGHGGHTCVLEIDGPSSHRVRIMHQKAWALLRSLDIPFTFHWGKQHDLTTAMVRKAYGDVRIEAWRAARHALLDTPALRRTFSNDMLERAGLHN